MTLQQTIKMTEPSQKHKVYANKALKYINGLSNIHINIAEGAIRAGKTIDNCFLAAAYLEVCPDRIHLASGSSIHNAKLNIGDCNGFGLEYLFKGRCRWGKYKDNEALIIQTQTGEKIVIFAGGGKADSYRGILGNSFGMWIATEIQEHYDTEDVRTSFIMNAQDRQLAALKPFILWDLNPCNPYHTIYTKFIDRYTNDGIANYGHFTIYDNSSLTKERIEETEKRYTKGTIEHRRNLLGERCIAEGLIYQDFADNEKDYYIDDVSDKRFIKILIGVDIGGTKSKHAFCAVGISGNYKDLIVLKAVQHKAEGTTPETIYRLFNKFQEEIKHKYKFINEIYVDSAEQVLKRGMETNCNPNIFDSNKREIMERIKATLQLMAQGRLKLLKGECEPLAAAFRAAVYNPKKIKDERLDDGTVDIDILDSFEYAWSFYLENLVKRPHKIT